MFNFRTGVERALTAYRAIDGIDRDFLFGNARGARARPPGSSPFPSRSVTTQVG